MDEDVEAEPTVIHKRIPHAPYDRLRALNAPRKPLAPQQPQRIIVGFATT